MSDRRPRTASRCPTIGGTPPRLGGLGLLDGARLPLQPARRGPRARQSRRRQHVQPRAWSSITRAASVRVLWVKGSGTDLATITAAGLPGLRLDELLPLREREQMDGRRDGRLPAAQRRSTPTSRGRRSRRCCTRSSGAARRPHAPRRGDRAHVDAATGARSPRRHSATRWSGSTTSDPASTCRDDRDAARASTQRTRRPAREARARHLGRRRARRATRRRSRFVSRAARGDRRGRRGRFGLGGRHVAEPGDEQSLRPALARPSCAPRGPARGRGRRRARARPQPRGRRVRVGAANSPRSARSARRAPTI